MSVKGITAAYSAYDYPNRYAGKIPSEATTQAIRSANDRKKVTPEEVRVLLSRADDANIRPADRKRLVETAFSVLSPLRDAKSFSELSKSRQQVMLFDLLNLDAKLQAVAPVAVKSRRLSLSVPFTTAFKAAGVPAPAAVSLSDFVKKAGTAMAKQARGPNPITAIKLQTVAVRGETVGYHVVVQFKTQETISPWMRFNAAGQWLAGELSPHKEPWP